MSIPPAKITTTENTTEKTPLKSRYTFWYRIREESNKSSHKIIDKKEYENQVRKIAEFETVEDFWAIFQHLRKPDSCGPGIDFQLFRYNIKPIWEDDNNKNGGKVSIKLRQGFTTIIWEEIIFSLIGDVLPENIKNDINGIVCSTREQFNILQIWFNNWNSEKNNIIEDTIKDLLQIPPEVNLEFKKFFTSEENTK